VKCTVSFVALVDKKLVGHLLFTPVRVHYSASGQSIASLALAPVSIITEYQRQAIGSQLITFALNELKSRNFPSIIVLGHEDYYPRFGFLPAKNYRIRASFPLKNENCFMALELQPQAFPLTEDEGVVEYLPEFGI
jgi:putative acetyltransferase